MQTYKLGEWKRSTLVTLQRIKVYNDSGDRPTLDDFRNGSISRWVALLRAGGYLAPGPGCQLTPQGIELLTQLQSNPALLTLRARQVKPSASAKVNSGEEYSVEVKGSNFFTGFRFRTKDLSRIHHAMAAFQEKLGEDND